MPKEPEQKGGSGGCTLVLGAVAALSVWYAYSGIPPRPMQRSSPASAPTTSRPAAKASFLDNPPWNGDEAAWTKEQTPKWVNDPFTEDAPGLPVMQAALQRCIDEGDIIAITPKPKITVYMKRSSHERIMSSRDRLVGFRICLACLLSKGWKGPLIISDEDGMWIETITPRD